MSTRLNFTTRDWFWLCVVIALLCGWVAHFQYSVWMERSFVGYPTPATDDELRQQMNAAIDKANKLQSKVYALETAAAKTLNADQKKQFQEEFETHEKYLQGP